MGSPEVTLPPSAGGPPQGDHGHPQEIGPRRGGVGWTPRIPREHDGGWTPRGPPHGEGNPWGPHAGNLGHDRNPRPGEKCYRDRQMKGNKEIWTDPQRSEEGPPPQSLRGRTVRVHPLSLSLTRVSHQALNREEWRMWPQTKGSQKEGGRWSHQSRSESVNPLPQARRDRPPGRRGRKILKTRSLSQAHPHHPLKRNRCPSPETEKIVL